MNLRDIEEAGQRFYAAKGRMNGEDADYTDEAECELFDLDDPTDMLQPHEVYPSELDEAEGELLEHLDDLYDPDL